MITAREANYLSQGKEREVESPSHLRSVIDYLELCIKAKIRETAFYLAIDLELKDPDLSRELANYLIQLGYRVSFNQGRFVIKW